MECTNCNEEMDNSDVCEICFKPLCPDCVEKEIDDYDVCYCELCKKNIVFKIDHIKQHGKLYKEIKNAMDEMRDITAEDLGIICD